MSLTPFDAGSTEAWVENHSLVIFFTVVAIVALSQTLKTFGINLQIKLGYAFVFLAAYGGAQLAGDRMYFAAFLIGIATALAEIIGKFKDEPLKALRTWQAIFYLGFNGGIAAFALYILKIFGVPAVSQQDNVKIVFAAGLGAMAVMRSKLFDVKVGEQNVSFGPEQIVKVFFDFMERDIDRIRSRSRIEFVRSTMGALRFTAIAERTKTMLESSIRLSEEDKKNLLAGIGELEQKQISEIDKSYRLGFLLYEFMGEDFVAKLYEQPDEEWKVKADLPSVTPAILQPFIPRSNQKLYFSYGQNMLTAHFMQETGYKLSESNHFLETTQPTPAKVKGYRLTFARPSLDGTRGLATLRPTGVDSDVVEGVLYRVVDETLRFIDSRRQNSRREKILVEYKEGKRLKTAEAFTYVAARENADLLPDKSYVNIMIQGAVEHKLSQDYVASLSKETTADQGLAASATVGV